MAAQKSNTPRHWLVDDICSHRFEYMSNIEARQRAIEAPRFRIDDITEYFYAGTDQEYWDLGEDFPCVRPPFNTIWCETDAPTEIVSESYGQREWPRHLISGWAAMMMYERADTPEARGRILKLPDAEAKVLTEAANVVGTLMVSIWVVSHKYPRPSLDPEATAVLFLNESGEIVKLNSASGKTLSPWFFPPRLAPLMEGEEPLSDIFRRTLDPCLLAVSLLHCRNTIKREEPLPRFIRKQKDRVSTQDKFYSLQVGGMRQVIAEATAAEGGTKRAFHICRGHFATYTEAAPLFGKLVGRYWVPPHTRGSVEAGRIHKTYRVTS